MNNLSVGYSLANGSGVLGSSIYRKQSMTIRRGGGGGGAYRSQRTTLGATSSHRRVYRSPDYRIPLVAGPSGPPSRSRGVYLPSSVASAAAYQAVAAGAGAKRAVREIPEEILTSLVPREPAAGQEEMRKGEQAFRNGSYAQALAHFETARQLSKDSPESLLSLARSSFALAEGSYSKTAEYLSKTLEIVPELLMVRVFPRSFYGKQQDYLQHAKKLEDHVKAAPKDAEAQFIIGYLRWRQGKPDEAKAALDAALAGAGTPELTKGIEILVRGIAAADQAKSDKLPEMDQPVEYPCAGIRLALPKGFEPRPLDRMRQVLKASKTIDGDPMTIVLALQPVAQNVTARGLWEWAMEFWRTSPAISDLRLVEERNVSIANMPAVGRLFTYSSRGVDAAVLGLCFIREVDRPGLAKDAEPIRIGYGLVIMTTGKQMTSMIPVINGVARSAELTSIRRPIDTPLELTSATVRDLEGRYALKIPNGWSSGHDEMGVVMGRMDYLLAGVASPAVRVVALDVPESMSAKACGESAIDHATKQQGNKVKILSQGPAKMGGVEGYQFVVEKRVPLATAENSKASEAEFSQPFIEVGRIVGVPGRSGRQNFFAVVLTCHDCKAEQAETIMEKLAAEFVFP